MYYHHRKDSIHLNQHNEYPHIFHLPLTICYLLSNYVNNVHTSKDTKYYDEYKYIISLRDKLEESFSKAYSIDKKSFKINRIHFNDNKLYCYVDYSNKKMKVEYDITNDIFKTLRENES